MSIVEKLNEQINRQAKLIAEYRTVSALLDEVKKRTIDDICVIVADIGIKSRWLSANTKSAIQADVESYHKKLKTEIEEALGDTT